MWPCCFMSPGWCHSWQGGEEGGGGEAGQGKEMENDENVDNHEF